MQATLIWPRRSLGSSCQTGKMVALLNELFFVFNISFLPKYRVIYYDYIVKWCMSATLIWPRRSIGSSCQIGKMAALLNELFFVFNISFLPKYRVIYYDYIVKWCSGI